jgi:2-succinyl-5-enolpyruvyl-6-hydroxy-3-cyclohexene-1-carboxylate synthase
MSGAPPSSADVQASFCTTLVDEWARCGIAHAVVSPGSRSTPMALALAGDRRWSTSVFHDERSASFAALGVAVSSGRPAILVCTSGTAAAHFHAAVVEADLSGVPMIVVTADRPPESRDVGAAQTIRQDGLYGSAVRWSHDPGVPDLAASSSWRSLARRALGASLGEPPGPVHLNLPFREPLVGSASVVPPVTDVEPFAIASRSFAAAEREQLIRRLATSRPLLVIGRGAPDDVVAVAVERGWPVLAESRSRRSDAVVTHFDSLLRVPEFADVRVPDLVVRIGEPPASKTLAQWLVRHEVPQIHVSCDARVYDADHRVATRIVTSPTDVIDLFASLPKVADSSWPRSWSSAESAARVAVRDHLDAMPVSVGVAAVVDFVSALPPAGSLVVSSSMPIRDVEWFAGVLGDRFVVANRGANGIDGVLATGIGVAIDRGGPVGVVVGDVALLHDSSSLAGLAARGLDIRILVVDNDGGGIFHHLPQATTVDADLFEKIYGTPHGTDFAALGRAHGLTTCVADDHDELRRAASTAGPSLTIVRTDRNGDVAGHRRLHATVAEALRAD